MSAREAGFAASALVFVVALLWLHGSQGGLAIPSRTWVPDLSPSIDAALKYVAGDMAIGGLTVSDLTRGLSKVLGAPIDFLQSALVKGFYFEWGDDYVELPPLPWITTALLLVIPPWWAGGRGLGVLSALVVAYVLAFGLWESTIITLVSVVFAVVFAALLGLALGIWASTSDRASAALQPLYDAFQTIPIFSYLTVILVFFGFGPVAALVATVIFAMPPMARATELALRETPQTVHELATITGCTPWQRLTLVLLPTARPTLLVGLNQATMLSLAMVIIASIIGAGGLGSDVLRGLKSMRLTEALLAGLAISLIAICIDRTLRAWTARSTVVRAARCNPGRVWAVLAGLLVLTVAAFASDVTLYAPDKPLIPAGRVLDDALAAVNHFARNDLAVVQDGLIRFVMVPFRNAVKGLPWAPTVALVTLAAAWLSGWRMGVLCLALLGSVAALGFWDRAMTSLYLVLLSLFIALVIGLPAGVLIGMNRRAFRVMELCTDIIQTLPTFVYLIPVVVMFGAGDFPALIAIVIYLFAPVIRYTANGIQQVSGSTLREAADMTGCTPSQRLVYILLPVAAPQIILGINQAVMLGFGMLVITALVGSRGLEEITLVAIAKVQPGQAILAGYCIAVLAIVLDRLLRGASDRIAGAGVVR